MLTEQPDGPVENFDSYATDDLICHQNWKARKEGYERLSKDVANGSLSDFTLVAGFLKEGNIAAFESVVDLVHEILKLHPLALSLSDIINPLCDRGLGGRPKVASVSKSIVLIIAENGSLSGAIQALIKVSSKGPKLKLITTELISNLVKNIGAPSDSKDVVSFAFKMINDSDGKVRKEALQLIICLRRSLGSAIDGFIEKLRDVQKAEIYKAIQGMASLEAKSNNPSPVKQSVEFKPSKLEEIKDCDAPIDVLSALSQQFFSIISDSSRKWQERMAAIQDVLIPLISYAKLKDGDYSNLVRCLRTLLIDPQLPLQLIGVRCIGYLCNGLGSQFSPYVRIVLPALIEKFKEKKTIYLDALEGTLSIINLSSCGINDMSTDVEPSLLSKIPHQRLQTLKWLKKTVQNDPSQRNTTWLISRIPSTLQKLQRDDKKDVRDAANELINALAAQSNPEHAVLSSSAAPIMGQKYALHKSPSMKKQRTSLHNSNPVPKRVISSHVTPTKADASHLGLQKRSEESAFENPGTPDNNRISMADRVSASNRVTANESVIMDLARSHENIFTKIRSSGMLQKMTDSKDWRERMEIIRTIRKMIIVASSSIVSVDVSQTLLALKARLADSNKNIVAEAAECIYTVLTSLKDSGRSFTKIIVSAIVPLLKDQKPQIQENATKVLRAVVSISGFDGLQPALPWALQTDSSVTTERICHILLEAVEPNPPSSRNLDSSARSLLKALVNRSHSLRLVAERLIPHLIANIGVDAVHRYASEFKDADRQIILPTLSKYITKRASCKTPNRTDQVSYELPPLSRPRHGENSTDGFEAESSGQDPKVARKIFDVPPAGALYATPVAKSACDEEPIGRLSAKFERNVMVSGTESRPFRRATPAKMVLNSPAAKKDLQMNFVNLLNVSESCQAIRSASMNIALSRCNEWERAFNEDQESARKLIGDDCAKLIQAIFHRLAMLMNNIEGRSIENAHVLVRTLEALLKRKECARRLDESHIHQIFASLLERLLDETIANHPNLLKSLRILGFYLIQNSIADVCIGAFIRHLISATELYFELESPDAMQIIEFTCLKCLKRASQRLEKEDFSIEKILLAIDGFFKAFPAHLFEEKNDMPIRALRGVIETMVSLKGKLVIDVCMDIGLQGSYVHRLVATTVQSTADESATNGTFSPTYDNTVAKASEGLFRDELAATGKSSMPPDDVVNTIFASLRRIASIERACTDMFDLMKKFPNFDITARLLELNDTHRKFVSRRIARMYEVELSKGTLSSDVNMHIPKFHES